MSTNARMSRNGSARRIAAASRAIDDVEVDHAIEASVLKDSLGFSIKRAQIRTYEVYYSTVGAAGLTPARLAALALIGEGEGISQIELAARLKVSGPSMVKVIDSLQEQGLVSREAHAIDRRRYAIVLTEQGKEKLSEIRELVQAYEAQIASRLSAQERRQLMRLLERIATDA